MKKSTLEEKIAKLNALADEATEAIKAFEARMEALGAGIPINLSNGVAFSRVRGRWYVTYGLKPCRLEGSREARICAWRSLGRLEEEMSKEIDKMIQAGNAE